VGAAYEGKIQMGKLRSLVSVDESLSQASSRIRKLVHGGVDITFSRLSLNEMDEMRLFEIDIRSVLKQSPVTQLLGKSVAEGPAYRVEGQTTEGQGVAIRVRINMRKEQTPRLVIERVWRLKRSWP
jgi:hypothetical protein